MGKRKISIEKISNDRDRVATFHKRRLGLIKKAMELSILCEVEVALIIFGTPTQSLKTGKLCVYSSKDIDLLLTKFLELDATEVFSNQDYESKSMKETERGGEEECEDATVRNRGEASREQLQSAVTSLHLKLGSSTAPQMCMYPQPQGHVMQQQHTHLQRLNAGGHQFHAQQQPLWYHQELVAGHQQYQQLLLQQQV